jgi:hypothetical protein
MKAVDIVQRRRRSRTEPYRGLARKGLTLRQLIVEHLQGHAHYRFTGSFEQSPMNSSSGSMRTARTGSC